MMLHDDELEAYERAVNELKRIDHLIYVSLKYTRTVDVIRNIIERMLNAYLIVFDDLLAKAERAGTIYEIPSAPRLKCETVRKLYKNEERLKDFLEFYLLLRQFFNAQYTARQEFRRYVTMTATFQNGEKHELDIDIITEYYETMKAFVAYAKELMDAADQKRSS